MNKRTRFSEFLEYYMKCSELRVDKTTFAGYKSIVKIHLMPAFGNMRIGSIDSFTVQNFVFQLTDKGLSSKSIKNILSLLRAVMSKAVKMSLINNNPCQCVDLPSSSHRETDCYNLYEVTQLIKSLSALSDSELKYKVAIELALLCGWRKSEICGLDWECVDLVNKTARVKKKRVLVPGQGLIEGKPKTPNSYRVSVLPSVLYDDLVILQLRSEKTSPGSPVISSGEGAPIYPQVLARWFYRFLIKNNLRVISLHKLRHTYASMLASLNVDIKQVSECLGHAQTSTTLDIYVHLFQNKNYEIADKLTELLYKNDDIKEK
ncbi:MAG: site-specific integrase [Clostridia bacterium]|nr:site-specific integrase [Clostridia bacterium]